MILFILILLIVLLLVLLVLLILLVLIVIHIILGYKVYFRILGIIIICPWRVFYSSLHQKVGQPAYFNLFLDKMA